MSERGLDPDEIDDDWTDDEEDDEPEGEEPEDDEDEFQAYAAPRLMRPLVPGVYHDSRGTFHLDVPHHCWHRGIVPSPKNVRLFARVWLKELRSELPAPVLIIARLQGVRVG